MVDSARAARAGSGLTISSAVGIPEFRVQRCREGWQTRTCTSDPFTSKIDGEGDLATPISVVYPSLSKVPSPNAAITEAHRQFEP